jgi:hypothetical protein
MLIVVALAACHDATIHGTRNALGLGPIERPPHEKKVKGPEPETGDPIAVGEVMRPEDPGEVSVSIGLGPWGAVAVDDQGHGRTIFGAETEILFAEQKTSHSADEAFDPTPLVGTGFDLGVSFYEDGARLGPVYVEAVSPVFPAIMRLAAGLAYDHDRDRAGPQLSISCLGFFVRAQALFGDDSRALFMMGFAFEPPLIYTRSR